MCKQSDFGDEFVEGLKLFQLVKCAILGFLLNYVCLLLLRDL